MSTLLWCLGIIMFIGFIFFRAHKTHKKYESEGIVKKKPGIEKPGVIYHQGDKEDVSFTLEVEAKDDKGEIRTFKVPIEPSAHTRFYEGCKVKLTVESSFFFGEDTSVTLI
jgi:hypothetical protein